MITNDDVKQLRKDFDNYVKTAEQYQFVVLMMIDIKFEQTEKEIASGEFNIEENQPELRAMFRCILKVMGKDYSEYEESEFGEDSTVC
jgi:hypothetical protein